MRLNKIGKLFDKYHKQLYITALAVTKNREQAEDAVHDALLAIAEYTGKIKNLKAYLFTAVRNKALYISMRANQFHNFDEILDCQEDSTDKQPASQYCCLLVP